MDLVGRTVVVTGASRGIGRAVALQLARSGAQVVAGARDEADLGRLEAEQDGIRTHVLDVRDPASVDALVNNAGVGVFGPVEDLTVEAWDRVFEVNVRGTFLTTRALLPSLRAQRGQVINVTSDVSARTFANGSLYTASKHAQRAFTRALQMELADDGVRVTEVRPGVVATHFADGTPRPADASALAAEDVADAIVYALTRPARMRLDEIHFHPQGQTPEY